MVLIFSLVWIFFVSKFRFSSCPVWPRIAPTASTNQVLRFNGVFWAYLTGFRPLKSSPGPFSPEAAAPDAFFLVLCGPAGLPDIKVDLGFPAATRASPYELGGSPGPKEEDREEDPTERLKRHRRHHLRHPNQKRKAKTSIQASEETTGDCPGLWVQGPAPQKSTI